MSDPVILKKNDFFHKQRFSVNTINQGAVLLECEWCGGRFESGLMLGGVFRAGEVLDGTFSGVAFLGGYWQGGQWLSGYDYHGIYRPTGDYPPHE